MSAPQAPRRERERPARRFDSPIFISFSDDVQRISDRVRVLQKNERALDEARQYLIRNGYDTQDMSNEQVREAVRLIAKHEKQRARAENRARMEKHMAS